ncbi:cold shock domain-containing protein [Pollutibacter soli]|uniref:cold-shock protein n=1 Tax=Pollutibacter soli TaxID=3034157 RepID=UPI003013430C
MSISWNKKERDNKKKQERKQKEEKKKERKEQSGKKGMDDMMAYLDENGNLTSVPPDPNNKVEFSLDDIEISVPKQEELSPEDLIRKGVITFFNSAKGFGFVEDSENRQRIFVHQSSANTLLQEGMRISFEIERGPKGYTAVNVSAAK